jgi:predicted DNA-binding transcriptional regulator AlpA
MSESRLISMKEAAELAGGLHPNTFRQRKAGTEHFTHVPIGRRVLLIRAEFEQWLDARINTALADERKRRKTLHLVQKQI